MHYTLHLTNKCNMSCDYCYVHRGEFRTMDFETACKAISLAAQTKGPNGIAFFGGEPLLCKDLIYQIVEYCRWTEKQQDCSFFFKVTTNGLLLDEEFLEFSIREKIYIALSHDGIREMHDKHRIGKGGQATFDFLSKKIDMVLNKYPYTPVLTVVNPDTIQYFAESVKYLYRRGFLYLITLINFAANWTTKDFVSLKKEYKKLAHFYFEKTMAEDKFYLSPFEAKISSHILGDSYCLERCELGKTQLSVAPDGTLFPCLQFVGQEKYSIGHVNTGVDIAKQSALYDYSKQEKEGCHTCAIRKRCNHYCGCLNMQTSGDVNVVSPILCAHERMLLPIADNLAEKLFRKRNGMFIQKHYNDMYPFLSAIEDKTR